MFKLVETKLQKLIFLIGGVLIFFRLYDVNYYQTYKAVAFSAGVAILTFVLLVVLRDQARINIQIHIKSWQTLKKYWALLAVILIIVAMILIRNWGMKIIANKELHDSEYVYQNCLDKVAALTTWKTEPYLFLGEYISTKKASNRYFDEWIANDRPYDNPGSRYWEVSFMKWMMENHADFCGQDASKIKLFLNHRFNETRG